MKYSILIGYIKRDCHENKLKLGSQFVQIKSVTVFALERDFASLYTLWGELSQNQLTNASVLSLPGETLKTDGRNSSIIESDNVHISS